MATVKLCTCEIIPGGQMVDNPACPFHHPPAPSAEMQGTVTPAQEEAAMIAGTEKALGSGSGEGSAEEARLIAGGTEALPE